MSQNQLVLFVILFGFFVFSSATWTTISQNLPAGGVVSQKLGLVPQRVPGPVVLEISAGFDIQVCIQEYIGLQGSISDCNIGGYFYFSVNNSTSNPKTEIILPGGGFETDEDLSSLLGEGRESNEMLKTSLGGLGGFGAGLPFTWKASTTLRTGSVYWVSVAYNSSADTGNFTLQIIIPPASSACNPGEIGRADGRCQTVAPAVPGHVYPNNQLGPHTTAIFNVTLLENVNTAELSININLLSGGLSNLDATFPNGSITVALRRGNAPNYYQNDTSATYMPGMPVSLSIIDPFPGYWYLSVNNHLNQNVEYVASFFVKTCLANQAGPNCTSSVMDLTNVFNATLVTGTGDYQYFTLRNKTSLIVGVATEKLTDMAPALLASFKNYPTNDSYLVSSSGDIANYIFGTFDLQNVTWNIGVWANEGQEYYIWANNNCPNGCMGKNFGEGNKTYGTCDTYTGLCDCESHYGNLTCTRTGLAVIWIVLIVIACAIILAIAVGVPVACYLRNRNRSRYERV